MPNDAQNHRRKTRSDVDPLILVKDSISGSDVGTLVNLNDEGFMLMGKGPVKEGCIYQFDFHFPKPGRCNGKMTLGAECLWLKPSAEGELAWAGFHIIDLSDDDQETIKQIISQLGH
ncbi:MAG: hypothetical protein COA42_05410 [Alteromonadaceae bacterium]|nr:MAG: hypothetical protein COA42_05410 [Alteromonadaceae bacterium]